MQEIQDESARLDRALTLTRAEIKKLTNVVAGQNHRSGVATLGAVPNWCFRVWNPTMLPCEGWALRRVKAAISAGG